MTNLPQIVLLTSEHDNTPSHTYPTHYPITGLIDDKNDDNGDDNQGNHAMDEEHIDNGDNNQGNNTDEDMNNNNGNTNQGNDANDADIHIESEPDNDSNNGYDDEENITQQQYIDATMSTKYGPRPDRWKNLRKRKEVV